MFVIEPDGKYAHAVAVSGFVADSNTAPSNGVRIVTPIFCTKIGTAADWIGWPVLSMPTAERVFEPAGALVATAVNGTFVLEANKVLPR